jgi:hypothetical protein
VSFTLLEAGVAAGLQNYEDTTNLQPQTKYYYSITQDSGSTFSNDVFVYTHACGDSHAAARNQIRNFDGFTVAEEDKLNEFSATTEERLNKTFFQGSTASPWDPCIVCPVEGSIIIDCNLGCEEFEVRPEEDINSITILGCGDICPPINFLIPPNLDIGICGWPPECNYSGDECFEAPIPGGTRGRRATTGGPSFGGYGGAGGHPGGSNQPECPCPSSTLSIICCEDSNNECVPQCGESGCIKFRICGGRGPYSVSSTIGSVTGGGGGVYLLCYSSEQVDVPGTAYTKQSICEFGLGATSCRKDSFGCLGQLLSQGDAGDASCADALGLGECTQGCTGAGVAARVSHPLPNCEGLPKIGNITLCATNYPQGICDKRSQNMIDAGCNPCELVLNGAIITVTDATGNSASVGIGY